MALIVTPGAPDADSYVDLDEYRLYCGNVGHELDGKTDQELEQALRRGTIWLDGTYGQRFIGEPATVEQPLEWPRKNAVWRGVLLPHVDIPRQVKNALCEAAWRETTAPGSLAPDYVGSEQIKRLREKVGELETETEYADSASNPDNAIPIFSVIDGMLKGFVRGQVATMFGLASRA